MAEVEWLFLYVTQTSATGCRTGMDPLSHDSIRPPFFKRNQGATMRLEPCQRGAPVLYLGRVVKKNSVVFKPFASARFWVRLNPRFNSSHAKG
jgi:hypothetical protein